MAFALIFGMLVGALTESGAAQPAGWLSTWIPIDTDACDCGGNRTYRDVNATYYNMDSQYLYLRMCTCGPAGWPSTGQQGQARYKWWFDTNGTAAYVHGNVVENAEFLLILEDLTDNANDPNPPRDRLGELTLMDDLVAGKFSKRWDSKLYYGINNAQTPPTGNSTWW